MHRVTAIGLLAAALLTPVAFATGANEKERARELFVDVCTACHTLDRVKVQAMTKEEWTGMVRGMVSEGAAVSEEELDLITTYLAEHYGVRDKEGKK